MEKFVSLEISFVKKHYFKHILLALLFAILSGAVVSFKNLNELQSARVMEMYVSFLGIILFTPLFMPEQDREIWRLEQSKKLSVVNLYILRILTAVIFLLATVSIFIIIMRQNNCEFPVFKLWISSACEMLFLGSIGFFVSAVTNQVVLGYMAAIMYYMINFGATEYLKKLALFQVMRIGKYDFWYYMLAVSVLLFAAGISIREIRSKK